MRLNAQFTYRNGTSSVDGICYIDVASLKKQLRDTEWGREQHLAFKMYVRDGRKYGFELGGLVDITMQDGQQFTCTVTGIDFTVRRMYTLYITSGPSDSSVEPILKVNGSVSYKTKTGGGIDPDTGYPKAVTVTWGSSIPCRYEVVSMDLLAKDVTEHYKDAKYTIYIVGESTTSEQLKLSDNNGNEIGEFSIISREYLDNQGITKIIV